MLKNERTFTTYYTGGAANGIAILHTDGSLIVQPDRGQKIVVRGLAEAVLEENAKYLAWREEGGGTPGAKPEVELDANEKEAVGWLERTVADGKEVARSLMATFSDPDPKQEQIDVFATLSALKMMRESLIGCAKQTMNEVEANDFSKQVELLELASVIKVGAP